MNPVDEQYLETLKKGEAALKAHVCPKAAEQSEDPYVVAELRESVESGVNIQIGGNGKPEFDYEGFDPEYDESPRNVELLKLSCPACSQILV